MTKFILVIGDHLAEDRTAIINLLNASYKKLLWHHSFPENNMHPWDHMRLLENCIIEANEKSLNSCIITNSAYIADHLCNLMAGYRYKEENAHLLLTKNALAFIDPNDVEAYEFKEGKLIDIFENRERGFINWKSIAEPADWVSSVYFEMKH
jgi:hypothetical protein